MNAAGKNFRTFKNLVSGEDTFSTKSAATVAGAHILKHPITGWSKDMRHGRAFFCFAISVAAASVALAKPAADVHATATAVDQRYNRLHSLQAEFTEIYRGLGTERTESGTLWLKKSGQKKPGKMRWEYRSPTEKLFVSDGRDVWFYLPGDRQARKMAARKLDDLRSPLAFLLGKTKLEKELRGLSWAPDVSPLTAGDVVLRGVPEWWADRVGELLLEITPDYRIARIVIGQVDGSVTEYRLQEQKDNVQVPDERFQFAPPEGVETVEGDLGP
jgi:outer membrane lipoprotein carrier protein